MHNHVRKYVARDKVNIWSSKWIIPATRSSLESKQRGFAEAPNRGFARSVAGFNSHGTDVTFPSPAKGIRDAEIFSSNSFASSLNKCHELLFTPSRFLLKFKWKQRQRRRREVRVSLRHCHHMKMIWKFGRVSTLTPASSWLGPESEGMAPEWKMLHVRWRRVNI